MKWKRANVPQKFSCRCHDCFGRYQNRNSCYPRAYNGPPAGRPWSHRRPSRIPREGPLTRREILSYLAPVSQSASWDLPVLSSATPEKFNVHYRCRTRAPTRFVPFALLHNVARESLYLIFFFFSRTILSSFVGSRKKPSTLVFVEKAATTPLEMRAERFFLWLSVESKYIGWYIQGDSPAGNGRENSPWGPSNTACYPSPSSLTWVFRRLARFPDLVDLIIRHYVSG